MSEEKPIRHAGKLWNELGRRERWETLEDRVASGKSFSVIARELGTSRNAAIGSFHRLQKDRRAKELPVPEAARPPRAAVIKPKKEPRPAREVKPIRPAAPRPSKIMIGGMTMAIAHTHPNDFKGRAEQRAASPGIERIERSMESCSLVPASKRLTCAELEFGLCKWPSGSGLETSFCGHDTGDIMKVYCTYHAKIAFTPAAERRSRSRAQLTSNR